MVAPRVCICASSGIYKTNMQPFVYEGEGQYGSQQG